MFNLRKKLSEAGGAGGVASGSAPSSASASSAPPSKPGSALSTPAAPLSASAGGGVTGAELLLRRDLAALQETDLLGGAAPSAATRVSTGTGSSSSGVGSSTAGSGGSRMVELRFASADDPWHFVVVLRPDEGYWRGGAFRFAFDVPRDYNMTPPRVRCETRVFHPNIDVDGAVCLNILRSEWSPSLDLRGVIFGLLHLFLEPNPHDPLNKEAGELLRSYPEQFERRVRAVMGSSGGGIR